MEGRIRNKFRVSVSCEGRGWVREMLKTMFGLVAALKEQQTCVKLVQQIEDDDGGVKSERRVL